jgi:SEC-C motif domain protein
MRCPCRRPSETRAYAACCEPYLAGSLPAPTAEALMRSRYTASVQRDERYLLATWHASTRPATLDLPLGLIWLSLKITRVEEQGNTATVAFVARSRIGGASGTLTETSQFVRESGTWYYVTGAVT